MTEADDTLPRPGVRPKCSHKGLDILAVSLLILSAGRRVDRPVTPPNSRPAGAGGPEGGLRPSDSSRFSDSKRQKLTDQLCRWSG